jgi:hypothetical protein
MTSNANELVAVAIRRPTLTENGESRFVISLSDVVANSDFYERLRSAEKDYGTAIKRWKKSVERIRIRKSDALPRWELGNSITFFQKRLQRKYKFQVTNMMDAISRDIGISHSALGYILRLREEFFRDEVKSIGLNWSKLQEALDIKNRESMIECIRLIRKGRLRTDDEIREFKRKSNSRL